MLHYEFDWSILVQPQFLAMIEDGVLRTFALALVSGVASFVLGCALAVARLWPSPLVRWPATVLAEVVRNLPSLFWILFFYFVFPELLPQAMGEMLHEWPGYAFAAGAMGLALDNGTYLSDVLRNGMLKIPKGQREAAASCGLSNWQECFWILCPQSLRAMMPAIINRMVHNFKNTSLCIAIALPELTWAIQQIESLTFKGLEVTAAATFIYSVGSLSIAFLLSRIFIGKSRQERDEGEEEQVVHG